MSAHDWSLTGNVSPLLVIDLKWNHCEIWLEMTEALNMLIARHILICGE